MVPQEASRLPASRPGTTLAPSVVRPEPAVTGECGDHNILDTLYFKVTQPTLGPKARALLRRHSRWLREYSDTTVSLEGRADDGETPEASRHLAEARVKATADFLISQGVSGQRLFQKSGALPPALSAPASRPGHRCVSFEIEAKMLAGQSSAH